MFQLSGFSPRFTGPAILFESRKGFRRGHLATNVVQGPVD